eukprot:NODE_3968_length_711_cov_20.972810_g3353_i0.p3 GENE.NODE_3968_length_711_cov_20.972810_g3353_i0~~NODE_3968_length_711_cov_20.972810_g3353_i0.p3  ORF type:complete len:84 (-),score=20.50 NODE_3968_length_711_cov_20.972810_g3353_i0:83-334(-)
MMWGQGKYTYANGSVYVGAFEQDQVHGQGTLIYANGDRYSGHFYKGKQHGRGKIIGADGVFDVLYENGRFVQHLATQGDDFDK